MTALLSARHEAGKYRAMMTVALDDRGAKWAFTPLSIIGYLAFHRQAGLELHF